ncbi:MAG: C39 family peptidase [Patescibacteria group bacterium]|jgi:peptidoglycan hydrolase CwlO-like protein
MKRKTILKFAGRLLAIILVANFLLPVPITKADSLTDLQSQLNKLMQQKKQNTAAIAQKQQDINTLKQQIQTVDGQISSTTRAIGTTAEQIDSTSTTIADLKAQIEQEEASLNKEQDNLSSVLSSWYMEGDSSLLEAIFMSDNLSEMFNRSEYYESVRQQVEVAIERIDKAKDELNLQKGDQERKLAELSDLKNSQESQKNYLENRKDLKSSLLNNTTSAVSSLQTEQKNTDSLIADIQGRIDKIRAASVGAGGDLVSAVDSSWYFQQDDSRWKNDKIGAYATIGEVGCLLTSLTMIAKYYGKNYDPPSAADASAFVRGGRYDGSLISTPIVSDGHSQTIDWAVVDNELANNRPVVVGVALGVDMGNSYGVSHFVVVKSKIGTGKYAIHDPLGPGRGYMKSQVKAMRIIRP